MILLKSRSLSWSVQSSFKGNLCTNDVIIEIHTIQYIKQHNDPRDETRHRTAASKQVTAKPVRGSPRRQVRPPPARPGAWVRARWQVCAHATPQAGCRGRSSQRWPGQRDQAAPPCCRLPGIHPETGRQTPQWRQEAKPGRFPRGCHPHEGWPSFAQTFACPGS